MARYDITTLNYISIGSNRVFFGFDSKFSIERENYEYVLSKEDNETLISSNSSLIRVNKYDNLIDMHQLNEFFNKKSVYKNNLYVGEFLQNNINKNLFAVNDDNDGLIEYMPLYDITDMSIKSSTNLNYQNKKIDTEDSYANIYAPDMNSSPIGCCQLNYGLHSTTYILSQPTINSPYIFNTTLLSDSKYRGSHTYSDMYLDSTQSKFALYSNLSDYNISTWSEYISSGGDILTIFEPKTYITNIERNYVYGFPMSDIITNYNLGNVYAEIIPCKNHLNSIYEMEIFDNTLDISRVYCGINKSSNDLYLKYYDINTNISTQNNSDISNKKYPYQKIEHIRKNKFTNRRSHKSNLFSINISDMGVLTDTNNTIVVTDDMKKMQDEIYHMITEVVKSVCPINTQLFKVYFGGR